MEGLVYNKGLYRTDSGAGAGLFPSLKFYPSAIATVFRAARKARRGEYGSREWSESSIAILRALERVGVKVEIAGTEHLRGLDGPCVFVSNHMSTLETFVLPGIIVPFRDSTFVVKKSLYEYPVFGHVIKAIGAIAVSRKTPREDLKTVLEKGLRLLEAGKSVVVFPESERTLTFDPERFNTIGIKLSSRASVPLVPVAVKSDAWGIGRVFADFGRIDPSKGVFFSFGEPLRVRGRGTEEHQATLEFIQGRLKEWGCRVLPLKKAVQ